MTSHSLSCRLENELTNLSQGILVVWNQCPSKIWQEEVALKSGKEMLKRNLLEFILTTRDILNQGCAVGYHKSHVVNLVSRGGI